MFHKDFYPTPKPLIRKMLYKIKGFSEIRTVLDPSAGKGDLLLALAEQAKDRCHRRKSYFAIEIVPELQSMLRGHGSTERTTYYRDDDIIHVLDSDFLKYEGVEQFDLIFANFPFSDGTRHMSKALDIMYSGQIVAVLNAESIRNPKTHFDKELVNRLEKLEASFEYVQDAFLVAERKTPVEVVIIYVNIVKDIETDLFGGMSEDDDIGGFEMAGDSLNELAHRNSVEFLVERYNSERDFMRKFILDYYSNYSKVVSYVNFEVLSAPGSEGETELCASAETLTGMVKRDFNNFSLKLKEKYWRDVINLDEVRCRMTSEKRQELMVILERSFRVEFTEANIKQFIINLIKETPDMLNTMIGIIFDRMTSHALLDNDWGEEYKKHIHYFNAWAANDAFCIKNKVIMPCQVDLSYEGALQGIESSARQFICDLDIVMSYFSDLKPRNSMSKEDKEKRGEARELMLQKYFKDTADIISDSLKSGVNKKIDTQFFYVSVFKKGTIHLQFKDPDLLRKFNLEACKGKNFIPKDYGTKRYGDLTDKEKDFVESFEGKKNYKVSKNNLKCLGSMNGTNLVQIGFKGKE